MAPNPLIRVFHPHLVLTAAELRTALGLKTSTLRREIRLGRLRASKRGGRYFFLGTWVLDWIRAGELAPRHRPEAVEVGR